MFTAGDFPRGDAFLKALNQEPATFKAHLDTSEKAPANPQKSLDALCRELGAIIDPTKLTPQMRTNLRLLVAHLERPEGKENVVERLLNAFKSSSKAATQKATVQQLLAKFPVSVAPQTPKTNTTQAPSKIAQRTDVEIIYGNGITNQSAKTGKCLNACYVNSVVQALRLMPAFRDIFAIQGVVKEDSALIAQLGNIFSTLENSRVDEATIQGFRQLAGSLGWDMDSITSQEDAALFLGFLLDQIEVPQFSYKMLIEPRTALDFKGLEAPGLLRQGGTNERMVQLGLGTGEATSVATLVTSNVVVEEVGRDDLRTKDGKMPSAAELQRVPEKTSVMSDQTVCFSTRDSTPQMLPIQVKRFEYVKGAFEKRTDWVEPSMQIAVPIEEEPGTRAIYHLHALVVHEGATLNSGHYYTYMPVKADDKPAMVEFNDSRVTLHRDPKGPYENASQNGYLYFYQLDGFAAAK